MNERKFIAAKAKGKTNKAAALEVNPKLTPKSAEVVGSRMANRPEVKLAIQKNAQQALIDSGVGMDDWMEVLVEARTATKLIVHGKNSEEGWTEEVPDWSARLKAFAEAMKISGGYNQVKEDKQPLKPLGKLNDAELEALQKEIAKGNVAALERIVFKDQG